MVAPADFALHYHPEAFTLHGKIMGRQAAGAGFLRAVARANIPRLWCYSPRRELAVDLARQMRELGAHTTGVAWVPRLQAKSLAEPGLLYRPDVGIAQDAWTRRGAGLNASYSVCGITHTLSTHSAAEMISAMVVAPVESWDALICTSHSARDAVLHVLESTADHLRERTGAARFTFPQLPVIPLGVHTGDFAFSEQGKAAAREELGISGDEVAVLFAGRLVVHAKAHPLPMFAALEQAAHGSSVVLVLAGQAPREGVLDVLMEEARLHCPSVRLVVVDGDDSGRYRWAWAAADIFTSLADSFQETFGLTPIEAMSAALPSVVSDWNGYRDGVRDGIDGFRIPTLALAPDRSGDLADRYDLGIDDFDRHSGHTGQFVAIDVERAAEAYRSLIRDPALRRRMGHQAQQRARVEFDWSVVFRRYQALWHELGDARRADRAPRETRRRPDRPDPFSMFENYSTHRLNDRTAFARCRGATPEKAAALRHAKSLSFATPVLPSGEVIDHVLSRVPDDEWVRLQDLAQGWPNHQAADCERALVWLAKVGILRFRDQA